MKRLVFNKMAASLLIVGILAPIATLFYAPPKTHALFSTVAEVGANLFTNIKTTIESTISAIEQTLTQVNTFTSMIADKAQWYNTYILQPLAFVLSGNLMKMLTAGVIAFVIGKANGTGVPQFIVDVQRSMQTVSDSRMLMYLSQIGQTNSPFSASIASSLRNNYLQNTSLAGFWKANLNTLARTSPNVNAYLSGRWQQGGVAAWFALTTQAQNNPYTLYQSTLSKAGSYLGPGIGGVTGARAQELAWGNGFMSWCGESESTTPSSGTTGDLETDIAAQRAGTAAAPTPNPNGKFFDSFGNAYLTQVEATAADTGASAASTVPNLQAGMTAKGGVGINPGDPCTKPDGTPGTIKTPGTTIKATLDKVLGGQQDQIVRMGNVGPQINQILGNIGTVLQTVQFASQILGGPGSGGLFGVDQTSSSNSTSRLMAFTPTQTSSGYMGVTSSSISQSQNTPDSPFSTSSLGDRVTQYESAWNTIRKSAETASSSVASLKSLCIAAIEENSNSSSLPVAAPATITAADTALTTEIAPVLAQAAAASTTIAAARSAILRVNLQSNATTSAALDAYSSALAGLQTLPPTTEDVARAQSNARSSGTTFAINADGTQNASIIVDSSLYQTVDRMNIISTNAEALKTSACTPPPIVSSGI
ncbi:MAG: hypothetical protein WA058_03000 [Minisyncoccia bacterium]